MKRGNGAEIHNCLWQGGMWATAEAEKVFPMDKLGEVSENANDRPAAQKYMKDHHDVYLARKAIAERLVARKYGLPLETIRAIGEEWGEKPKDRRTNGNWTVSEVPVLFDREEADRAVSRGSIVPLNRDEEVKEERQHLIDKRRARRSAQGNPSP